MAIFGLVKYIIEKPRSFQEAQWTLPLKSWMLSIIQSWSRKNPQVTWKEMVLLIETKFPILSRVNNKKKYKYISVCYD